MYQNKDIQNYQNINNLTFIEIYIQYIMNDEKKEIYQKIKSFQKDIINNISFKNFMWGRTREKMKNNY